MALFSVRDLSFAYPDADRRVLENVSVDIERGEYLCVCGKSGCGKTTLLRQLKSVLSPHGKRSGTVLLDGVVLDEVSLETQARRIGFVMQDPDAQIVTDRVFSELSFGLESIGCETSALRLRVAEMASYFGMQDWLYRDVAELSGGQKQLLNLAGVMAMQPDVLVLDEPTSQLDPIATEDFLNTVRRINRELGCTVIITEHRLESVFSHADRVLALDEGHVTAHGTPREVANALYATGDDMTLALPSPVRVYYGVEKMDATACPLTVREGRTWLVERVLAEPPARVSIPDDLHPRARGRSRRRAARRLVPLRAHGARRAARRKSAHRARHRLRARRRQRNGQVHAAQMHLWRGASLPRQAARPGPAARQLEGQRAIPRRRRHVAAGSGQPLLAKDGARCSWPRCSRTRTSVRPNAKSASSA